MLSPSFRGGDDGHGRTAVVGPFLLPHWAGHLAGRSPAMTWCTMPSTSIRKFEYDPETRVLSVWFVASGRQYDFLDVPPEIVADFKSAFAKGRYFNDRIRNQFAFRTVASSGSSGSC
ncbi:MULTISPECIES: KTSC domain-containing protein [unclassified Mesorhizobium]|uniref:KTSC domain-containing protein n=1 Tax=unclassified Mesorhizobium TaxID=325217 RepID=UPI001FE1C108|nr:MULTISPECIES: KTSC domain-containing protein [unclassified Mesorhizobium]